MSLDEMPKGVGQLPSWWLDNVLHDTRDDVLRQKRRMYIASMGLPEESIEDENRAIALEKERSYTNLMLQGGGGDNSASTQGWSDSAMMTPMADHSSNSYTVDDDHHYRQQQQQQQDYLHASQNNGVLGSPMKGKVNVTMTNEEELAAVEARRQKEGRREEFGQGILRKREGNVKKVESFLQNRERSLSSSSDDVSHEVSNQSMATAATLSTATTANTTNTPTAGGYKSETYETTFLGVSPFDFAMQQKAKEKERRQKERAAREALSVHHGAGLEAARAAEQRARENEERRKKREAEDLMKGLKTADLDKKYESKDKEK